MPWLLAEVLLFATLVAMVSWLRMRGHRRWCVQSSALSSELRAEPGPTGVTHFDLAELNDLPAPVQRYLRVALTPGQPLVCGVRIMQSGFINLSIRGRRQPFTAEHQIAMRRPGFLWHAQVNVFAGLNVRVHRGYLGGVGLLHESLLGFFNVARHQGGGEMARAELMRFLAEAPWYPTGLLPSQGVQWSAVDERHADAKLTDGAVSVTLRFKFGNAGLVESVRSEARGRWVGRTLEMTRWEGRWKEWVLRDGMRVPLSGEGAWLLLEGRQTYWSGRLSGLRYQFSG